MGVMVLHDYFVRFVPLLYTFVDMCFALTIVSDSGAADSKYLNFYFNKTFNIECEENYCFVYSVILSLIKP